VTGRVRGERFGLFLRRRCRSSKLYEGLTRREKTNRCIGRERCVRWRLIIDALRNIGFVGGSWLGAGQKVGFDAFDGFLVVHNVVGLLSFALLNLRTSSLSAFISRDTIRLHRREVTKKVPDTSKIESRSLTILLDGWSFDLPLVFQD
jgi:hypothetical protein